MHTGGPTAALGAAPLPAFKLDGDALEDGLRIDSAQASAAARASTGRGRIVEDGPSSLDLCA